jgi:hypothetical protein
MTENKQPLSTVQLLDLITVVEHHIDHIKPLLQMTLNNPTVGMKDYLQYDKTARETLTKMTRMLMAAASDKDFNIISFMLNDEGK